MTCLSLHSETLTYNNIPLLTDVKNHVTALADPLGVGLFLRFSAEQPAARHVFRLGKPVNIGRILCHYRYKPYWMMPAVETNAGDVPLETQFLLAELSPNSYVLLVPLLDGAFRMSLQGANESELEVIAESGDPAVTVSDVQGLFIAVGSEPFALIEQAAQSVSAWLKTGRLRRHKGLPAFIDQFGWCTWNAFYETVSQEKIRQGLESFAAGGVSPKWLVLDAGWQSVESFPTKMRRLTAFQANEKFPGGLANTVSMAKGTFGIQTFLVWHAILGATGGIDQKRLPDYRARYIAWHYSQAVLQSSPDVNEVLGSVAGVIPPEFIYSFYNDYHRSLRLEGVDGVKVDFQTTIEALGATLGGRVELVRRYHEAMEGSTHTHFQGNLINCMSCSNDMLYSALNSNLTRTSDDFYPTIPDSHGRHLYANAHVGLWFGEFIHPDWDMFQSAHALGAFHAASRAISGGPVYVSDTPDAHDFALLRKLVLPTGHVLRAQLPGRPTKDSLFNDPVHEDVPLKIFNRNVNTGVVGVFNCHAEVQASPLSACISPQDVDGLSGERFAVYAHAWGEVRVLAREDTWMFQLPAMGFELFTIAAIERGVAPLGLVEMFNSGAAIIEARFNRHDEYELLVHTGGKIALWCAQPPQQVWLDEQPATYDYQAETHLLSIYLDQTTPIVCVRINLADMQSGEEQR